MKPELLDCQWCGSARSIEFGLCQVCMMEYTTPMKIIHLPAGRPSDGTSIHTGPGVLDTPDIAPRRVEMASGD